MSFLQIATHNIGAGGTAAGLRKWDILLAVNGEIFTEDARALYLRFQNRADAPWLLTIKRQDLVVDVLIDTPFVADFVNTDDETTITAQEVINKHRFLNLSDYRNFEVYRDKFKNADLVDTRKNPFAGLFAPVWMLHNRLYLLLFLVITIYFTAYFAHLFLLVITALLVGIYTQRAQINLKRAYCDILEKKLWMVVASNNEISVVEKIIAADEETSVRHFIPKSRRI